jgi:hypothetical protein
MAILGRYFNARAICGAMPCAAGKPCVPPRFLLRAESRFIGTIAVARGLTGDDDTDGARTFV